VARHPANRAAARSRGLDGEEPAIRPQLGIEPFEHHAGLDRDGSCCRVIGNDFIEMAREIEDETAADRLTDLKCAGAPCDARGSMLAGNAQARLDVGHRSWTDHPGGHDLVDGGVGRIAAAREGVEADLAFDRASKALLESDIAPKGRAWSKLS